MLANVIRPISRRTWIRNILSAAAIFQMPRRSLGQEKSTSAMPSAFRVRSIIELNGEVHLKAQNAPSTTKDGKPAIARRAPVESKSTLDYDQQYILGETDESIRGYLFFHEAHSEITVDRHTTQTVLRDNCKEIVKLSTGRGIHPAALSSPLFAAERELVNGAVDSMYLDQLLTEKEVAIADKWNVDRVSAARLLHLDAILDGDLTVCLIETDDEKAHLEISGKLQATAKDVGTQMEIKGKALMDRKGGYISWLAMQIDETREIGEAEPGFKVVASIRVLRAPIESMSSGRSLAQVWAEAPSPESAEMLQFQSDLGFYRFLADCRWSTYRDNGEEATLRYVVNNRRVAQCNITNLVDSQPGDHLSLEGYQADLERVASRAGREILEATEQLTASKHRMLRITMTGSVDGIPLRWIHYHISNDMGRRLALVFTTDESSLDVFANQDAQIIDSMELLEWPSKLDASSLESQSVESAAVPGNTKK
jgi:hypothetical protein